MCEINEKVLSFLKGKVESKKTAKYKKFEDALSKMSSMDMEENLKYTAAFSFVSDIIKKEDIYQNFETYKSTLTNEKEQFLKVKVESDKNKKIKLEKEIENTKKQTQVYEENIETLKKKIEELETKSSLIDDMIIEKTDELEKFETNCEDNMNEFIFTHDELLTNIEEDERKVKLYLV